MNLAFLISTTKSYYDQTVKRIITEAQVSGIPSADLFIVSSQESSNDSLSHNNVKIFKVTYTGIHLTPLIHVSENLNFYKNYTHFCLLHSTSTIGPTFHVKLKNILSKLKLPIDAIPFNSEKDSIRTKDMGILSRDQILSLKNYLKAIKQEQYTPDSLLQLKKQLIFDENLIFGLQAVNPDSSTNFELINCGRQLVVNNGIEDASNLIIKDIELEGKILRKTSYPSLDLHKYQRTFDGLTGISMDSNGSIPKQTK